MKFKIFLISFLIFCFFLSIDQVLALGVGANPSFLDLELKVNQQKEAKILVYNISQEPGIFQIFPEELKDWIKIRPDNFRLEAGENKEVEIKVLAKEGGQRATDLSVSAIPLDRQSFSISPGLKIPLRLNVMEERPIFLASVLEAFRQSWPWLIVGILVICLIGIFLIKYFKRRKKIIARGPLKAGGRREGRSPPENLPIETSINRLEKI